MAKLATAIPTTAATVSKFRFMFLVLYFFERFYGARFKGRDRMNAAMVTNFSCLPRRSFSEGESIFVRKIVTIRPHAWSLPVKWTRS